MSPTENPIQKPREKRPLLADTLPAFAADLQQPLIEKNEPELNGSGATIGDFGAVRLRRRFLRDLSPQVQRMPPFFRRPGSRITA
jgi:hypothetical protein